MVPPIAHLWVNRGTFRNVAKRSRWNRHGWIFAVAVAFQAWFAKVDATRIFELLCFGHYGVASSLSIAF